MGSIMISEDVCTCKHIPHLHTFPHYCFNVHFPLGSLSDSSCTHECSLHYNPQVFSPSMTKTNKNVGRGIGPPKQNM